MLNKKFIEKAIKIYGDKYDYSKVEYDKFFAQICEVNKDIYFKEERRCKSNIFNDFIYYGTNPIHYWYANNKERVEESLNINKYKNRVYDCGQGLYIIKGINNE